MIDRIVGANIAKLRRERGISVADLASRCSLTADELTECENGARRATPKQIFELRDVLNVLLDQLFEGMPGGQPVDFDAFAASYRTPNF